MISIYTHTNNPTKKEFWKFFIKKILKKYSGPNAVLDSLKRGLIELNIPFEINPLKPKFNSIIVLSGVEVLKERILLKNNRQKLIAGPTVLTTPLDEDCLLTNEKIDLLLTPSEWVRNFYLSLSPTLNNKIYIWPAGVKIPKEETDRSGPIIIYKKNIEKNIFNQIINILNDLKTSYEVLEYGKFNHQEYIKKLLKAPLIIYLQKTESQGLALQEAWSYNVPTLVLQNNKWENNEYRWVNENISAPYLNDECGCFFNIENFQEKLQYSLNNYFNAKEYCKNHLSDIKSTELLLDIIKNENNN